MRTIVILIAISFLFSLSSCKKKKKEIIEAPKTQVVETPKTEPVAVVKETPVVRQMNYFLIAGCFKIKSNADHLTASLNNEGYDSKIIPYYNMYMVTYKGYETRQEAQDALNRIVLESGKSKTWVYPLK